MFREDRLRKPRNATKGSASTIAAVTILAIIVGVGAALSAGYAQGVPPWNAPDEPAHYNYVRHIATTGQLPELKQGDWDAPLLERLKSAKFPRSESVDSIAYESHQPPLFYLMATPVYNATAHAPLLDRVHALRLLSVALAAATVVLGFLAVRTIFPEELPLQLAVAGFIAFLPMRSAVSGSVSNDALAEMVANLLLLMMLWIMSTGLRARQALLLGVLMGVGLLTKTTVYGYLPLALGVALLYPVGRSGSRWRLPALSLLVAGAVSCCWFVRNGLIYGYTDIFGLQRHDQIVVGQPRLEQLDAASLSYLGTTLFKSFWGQFGWMGILIDERLYQALGVVSALAAFGLLLFLARVVFGKGSLSPYQRQSLALMGIAVAVVVAEVAYYNLSFVQAQGRYLYPGLLPIALFYVLGLRELLAPVHARFLLAIGVVSLALLDYVCLVRFVIPYFKP
jgi:4-amino-4-deoxy-L-arabinose transferase-like glycosyltransferase